MAPSPRRSWIDRATLWSARTLLLTALATLLTLTLVPAKITGVWLEAITHEKVWSAIVTDLNVGATIAAPARAVAQRVPLEQLQRLNTVLGVERTEALILDLETVQEEVALALEEASDDALEQIVGTSIPNFLTGEDLTGQALHRDLSLDLSVVRDELHQSFQHLGHLLVDAGADAASQTVREHLSPEAIAQLETLDVTVIEDQLAHTERQLTALSRGLDLVVLSLPILQYTGVTEDDEDAARAAEVTQQLNDLAELGLMGVAAGRAKLQSVSEDPDDVDWEAFVVELTDVMVAEIERNAEARAALFAESFANALLGEGVFQAPLPVRLVLVEQLRPLQIAIAGAVHLANATRVFVGAAVGCLGLSLLLATGRMRRSLWWFGWVGLFSAWAVGLAGKTAHLIAQGLASGIGGLGSLLQQAGAAVGVFITWCWRFVADLLDVQPVAVTTIMDGWTAADVVNSETYGVFMGEFVTPLQSWSGDIARGSALALVAALGLTLVEFLARRGRPRPAQSWFGRLQQHDGLRNDDPLWAVYPSQRHALLLRPILLDVCALVLLWLGLFSALGGFFLLLVGPTGLEFALTPVLALTTSVVVGLTYGGLRAALGSAHSVHGKLFGEQDVSDERTHAGTARTFLGLSPPMLALGLTTWFVSSTSSTVTAVVATLLLWLVVEGFVLVLTKGEQTLSAWLAGRVIRPGHDGGSEQHRRRITRVLTKAGTVWSLLWGIGTVGIGGLGLYALLTSLLSLLFWYQHARGEADTLRERPTAYIRLGSLLSLDLIGMTIGWVTLHQLDATQGIANTSSPIETT